MKENKKELSTRRVLLHVCCAPCACGIIDILLKEDLRPFLYFYNPNISPTEEYEHRKASIKQYAVRLGLDFIDADYENELWEQRIIGLEKEPERGKRCSLCFDLRLEKSALYASENGFSIFATTNGIGRWKDINQVNQSGLKAASRYPGLIFMDRNWRKGNTLTLSAQITLKEGFYRQKYCGCRFSQPKPQV